MRKSRFNEKALSKEGSGEKQKTFFYHKFGEVTMKITIPGDPLAQQRPRFHLSRSKRIIVYDPLSRDKELIKRLLKKKIDNNFPDHVPLEIADVKMTFYMKIPKSLKKAHRELAEKEMLRHVTKPDSDNLVKLYLDCLVGTFLADDKGVNLLSVSKVYSTYPRTEIEIFTALQELPCAPGESSVYSVNGEQIDKSSSPPDDEDLHQPCYGNPFYSELPRYCDMLPPEHA